MQDWMFEVAVLEQVGQKKAAQQSLAQLDPCCFLYSMQLTAHEQTYAMDGFYH
jgi:hypothetical protein